MSAIIASATATPAPASTSASAQTALSGNYSTFLHLLTTQLRNQDPTSPLDTNQFTQQLVQYSQVEQQIGTNSNLTQLIQLTQGSEVLQSAGLLGKQVEVTSDHLSLQSGHAAIDFTTARAGPAQIVVSDDKGNQIATATVAAAAGANAWHWDGSTQNGGHAADGAYRVAVTQEDGAGAAQTLPYTVIATATAVKTTGNVVQLQMGGLTTPFSDVRSVTGAATP